MEERRGEEDGRGGAGGKLTKRSFQTRVQSTPYDRPPRDEACRKKKTGGWFSKLLVQPASMILPSLFPSSSSKHEDPPPPESLPEVEQEDCDTVSTLNYDNQIFESKEPGASAKTGQPTVDSKVDELVGDKLGNTCDSCGLAEIEQRLKQKKFSRDETNRLLELLRLRTTDLPDDDGRAAGYTFEAAEDTLGQKDSRTSKEEYGVQSDYPMTWRTSDRFQFTAHDVSSSPVEITKAYMEARRSAADYDCQRGRLKNESSFCSDNSASKLSFTSVAKSPICWPGAVVQRDHGYFTPRRGQIGLCTRTPYSGAVFSKSTSKFQVNDARSDLSSAELKRSFTRVSGDNTTAKRMNSVLDDGFASVSPIRHVWQKNIATTASKGAGPCNRATSFSSLSNSSDALNGFSSTTEGNLEHGSSKDGFKFQSAGVDETSRFAAGSLTVHPQSTEMARKILEHLDRTVPSPKEKSLELKLAVARLRVPRKSATLVIDGQDDSPVVSISCEQKTGCVLGRDMVAQECVDAQKVLLGPSTSLSNDKDRLASLPPSGKQGILGLVRSTTANSAAFQIPENWSNSSHETSNSTAKASKKLINCDNGYNFTFPVPAASNAFSEPPPTPTMTSSLAASRMPEASEGSIPSFNFGTSRSDGRLVFSFGSSSVTDTTTPDFKFGTEKKCNLSFKSIGEDAICY